MKNKKLLEGTTTLFALLLVLIATPTFAAQYIPPSSPDYVPPAPDPSAVAPFIAIGKYSLGGQYNIVSPHTPTTEKLPTFFFPEYVHEIVDLRADLTDVQSNVSRLSVQQFNTPTANVSGSVNDPHCDSLDARVRQLEQQLATLGSSSRVDDLSDDPNIQTITRRLTTVEGVVASNDGLVKRIMKFLKLK